MMQEQIGGPTRYTLVGEDGTVLYDSQAAGTLENHADRPEILEAQANGTAVSSRYSQTLKTDLMYAAVRLGDGDTVRLAQERQSYAAYMGWLAVPLGLLITIMILVDYILSRMLTRRIMQPINDVDVDAPMSKEIYEEVSPLLVRIDDQRARMQEQNEALAEAENLRREFSANVSHEMKTPLTVISGYAELMKNDMVKPEDRQHIASLIFDESQKMRALIDDVLVISRLEESSLATRDDAPIDLHAIAQTVAARLEPAAPSGGYPGQGHRCDDIRVGHLLRADDLQPGG